MHADVRADCASPKPDLDLAVEEPTDDGGSSCAAAPASARRVRPRSEDRAPAPAGRDRPRLRSDRTSSSRRHQAEVRRLMAALYPYVGDRERDAALRRIAARHLRHEDLAGQRRGRRVMTRPATCWITCAATTPGCRGRSLSRTRWTRWSSWPGFGGTSAAASANCYAEGAATGTLSARSAPSSAWLHDRPPTSTSTASMPRRGPHRGPGPSSPSRPRPGRSPIPGRRG